MQNWIVDLIIGLAGIVFGFIGGFFTKTYLVKNKQQIKGNKSNSLNQVIQGNNNNQSIGDINNERK